MKSAAKLTPHQERLIAVTAGVDPRTVQAFLAGRRQRSTAAARVKETLEKLGFAHFIPVAPTKLEA